jgi:hypothetical protein
VFENLVMDADLEWSGIKVGNFMKYLESSAGKRLTTSLLPQEQILEELMKSIFIWIG